MCYTPAKHQQGYVTLMKTSRRIFDSETMRSIGERLREIRGDKTLAEFSELIGVSRTTWSNYEAGRRLPSHELVGRLKDKFNIDIKFLIESSVLSRRIEPADRVGYWWSYMPSLWIYNKMKGKIGISSESKELAWWAFKLADLEDEFATRIHALLVDKDIEVEDAAIIVCEQLDLMSFDALANFIGAPCARAAAPE